MRIVPISLLILITSLPLAAQTPQGLTGTWQSSQYGFTMVLVLNADGTGEFDEEPIKFRVKGSTLAVTEDGDVSNYTFALNGATLTLSGGDLDRPMVFQRQGAGASAPAATAGAAPARGSASTTPGSKGLVGRWQGAESVVQINADNTMIIGGERFRYSVAGNILTLTGADGSLPMPFELKGDTLVVAVNGQLQTLKRLGDAAAEPAAGASGRSGAASVRPELVGKWCYFNSVSANAGGGRMTEECITLNGDGSYQYYSATSASAYAPGIYGGTASQGNDSGRWTATASTITAQSSKGQTTNYALELRNNKNNDPMICLEGRCYATAYQKAPWR